MPTLPPFLPGTARAAAAGLPPRVPFRTATATSAATALLPPGASATIGTLSQLVRGRQPTTTRDRPPRANTPTFAFEQVAAILQPFDLSGSYNDFLGRAGVRGVVGRGGSFALRPIIQTGGLVFPYNPAIREGVRIKYESVELTHRNESYYRYKSTDNVRISLTECIWTCDTFRNALYALAVLHFLRRYRFMDFGRGRTGRPPRPMWFSAYGNYAYYKVPVLMEKAEWRFPQDIDYIGIPEPGRPEYQNQQLMTQKQSGSSYTWLPIKFTARISLIVQHRPRYWVNWSLDDYRRGAMLTRNNSFHFTNSVANSRSLSGLTRLDTRLPAAGPFNPLTNSVQTIAQQIRA